MRLEDPHNSPVGSFFLCSSSFLCDNQILYLSLHCCINYYNAKVIKLFRLI
nr:MAG TPA: hypothetical protein [Caudoviricetes sp.]